MMLDAGLPPSSPAMKGWSRLQVAMFSSKLARTALYVLVWALLAYHLEVTAGIDPKVTQSLASLVIMFQLARPFFAGWSDTRPPFGYRRKSFAAAGNVLFIAAAVALFSTTGGGAGTSLPVLAIALLAYGAGDALQDIAFDSWLLDVATIPARKSRGQLVMRLGVVGGTVIGYGLGGVLVDARWDLFVAILLASCVASTALGFLVPEQKTTPAGLKAIEVEGRKMDGAARDRLSKLSLAICVFVMMPFAAEALANVMLEPWLVDRFGVTASLFFGVELLGSLVSLVAIGLLLVVPRFKQFDPARLLVVLLSLSAWHYIAIGWFSPDLLAYLCWNIMQFSVSMLSGVALDRMLMDVVHGARRGTTFQVFALFLHGGALLGNAIGPFLVLVIGMDGIFLLAAALFVSSACIYAGWLKPALAKAREWFPMSEEN